MDIKVIKTLRKGLGISLKELSERSGIDRGLLSLIESGKANPTLKTLEKIERSLNIKIIITL